MACSSKKKHSEMMHRHKEMAEERQPHAVFLPYPAQGHINPMMQLAKILISRGVLVTLIAVEHHVARMRQAQQVSGGVDLVGISDGLPERDARDPLKIGWQMRVIARHVEEFLTTEIAAGRHVTCVVADALFIGIREVTHKLGIPRAAFWPQSATTFSIYRHWDLAVSGGYDPLQGLVTACRQSVPLQLIESIPGVLPIHPGYLPFDTSFGIPGVQGLEQMTKTEFGNMNEAFMVVGNTCTDLEPSACENVPVLHAIGPLVPSAMLVDDSHKKCPKDTLVGASLWKEDGNIVQWLDSKPPSSVLYVSFGSVTRFSIAQIQEIAFGLLASEQCFLWAIRDNTVKDDQGGDPLEALPMGFLEKARDQGRVTSWAPQPLILAHPSVCGFFSHCGWNSTLESICAGVPMIGWPWIMDQPTNCWLLAKQWKIAVELPTNELNESNRSHIEKTVRVLMNGSVAEEMRVRALGLRKLAQDAMQPKHDGGDGAGSSARNLENFVRVLFSLANKES